MTDKPVILTIDCENQEIVEREMTPQEIEEKIMLEQQILQENEQKIIELQNKENLKISAIEKLLELGLSQEEINALIF